MSVQRRIPRYLDALLSIAYRHAYPGVYRGSRTLARAMEIKKYTAAIGSLFIPHFWAIYVNDGRGPVAPVVAKFLVWFRNPLNDPRLRGGRFPVRLNEVRRMTKDQFYLWMQQNREARKLGLPEPMVVSKGSAPTKPEKFFDNDGGMKGLSSQTSSVAAMVQDDIKVELKNVIKIEASLTLEI